jgi:hypothetical protein
MANEFARNIQDASLNPATFALPTTIAAAGAKTSAAVDLGTDTYKPERFELELSIPALTDTMAPAAATAGVTYSIESSTTSTFAAVARTIVSKNLVGTGSGVAAQKVRCRVPADCEQFIRAKVLLGTTCTDASALAGTLTLRF